MGVSVGATNVQCDAQEGMDQRTGRIDTGGIADPQSYQ